MMKLRNSLWMLLWLLSNGIQCYSCLAAFQGNHTFTVENIGSSLPRRITFLPDYTAPHPGRSVRTSDFINLFFSVLSEYQKSSYTYLRTFIRTDTFLAVFHICESGFLL
jgi:hypothetical protein